MRSNKAHDQNYSKIYQQLYQYLDMHHNIKLKKKSASLNNRITFIYGHIRQHPAIVFKYLKNVKFEDKIKIRLQFEVDTSMHLFEASVDETIAFKVLELLDSDHLTGRLKIRNTDSNVKRILSTHYGDEPNLIENLATDYLIFMKLADFFCPYY
jgi:hypothetical protein